MPFMNVTTSSGCWSAISAVHVITAGMLALQRPVRVARQVLDRLQVLKRLALGVDRIHEALLKCGFQRAKRQVVLVITLEPQLERIVHRIEHLRVVIPVIRTRELDDLDVVAGHAVEPQHQLDALFLLDTPPVVLDGVQALRQPDVLAPQITHPVDVVAGAHQHAPALVRCVGGAEQPGLADVGMNVDRREQTPEPAPPGIIGGSLPRRPAPTSANPRWMGGTRALTAASGLPSLSGPMALREPARRGI
jgi:hypothetical protein